MTEVFVRKAQRVVVHQDAGRVDVVVDGQRVLDMTWQQCLELGKALIFQARKAEEIAKVDQVVFDQAVLMRAGVPLRLATNDDMLKLAGNEAAWNSELRRHMPNKIEQYGTMYPPVVKHDESVEK